MTELERYKEALEYALSEHDRLHKACSDRIRVDVSLILNPPPEMEEVTVERWSWGGFFRTFETKEQALHDADSNEPVTKLRCTYRRAGPQKVERSVSIEAEINGNYRHPLGDVFGKSEGVAAYNKVAFYDHPECHGKRGTLTFSWEE